MRITIDEQAGPCGGVNRVIRLAENDLKKGEEVASLGAIIHNNVEIGRLEEKGLRTADLEVFDEIKDTGERPKLLIRAHGEPPSTYQRAEELGVDLVDGTCPVVTRSQKAARKYHDLGYQVVIIGKPKHPEIISVLGYCDGAGKVVHNDEEVAALDPERPTYVLAQTTISDELFETMLAAIQRHVKNVTSRNTICAFVSKREDQLRDFAARHDVVLFVGGKNSSNTKVMHQVCLTVNPKSYWIESADDVEPEWFDGAESVGVSGSASTPSWLLEDVGDSIARRFGAPMTEPDAASDTPQNQASEESVCR